MSISGSEKYRILAMTPCIEEYKRSEMVTRTTTEHTIVHPLNAKGDSEAKNGSVEPVYAVVDLQNKYDQRKKRSLMMEEKRCSSYESIFRFEENKMKGGQEKSLESIGDAVYEDGDMFCASTGSMKTPSSPSCEAEENIYEPINVKTSKFEFRKYISRLKLNPFLSTAPTRKIKTNFLVDVKLPTPNGALSRFSTLRCKLGKHRKSVQRRMRNLYKNNYEPNPLFQYHEEKHSAKPLSSSSSDVHTPFKRAAFEDGNGNKEEDTMIQTEGTAQRLHKIPAFKKVSKVFST